jgi:glycogen(starch) synthase
MDICMMSRSVPAHGLGGMERHTHLLCRELVRSGHSVTVISTSHPSSLDKEVRRSVEGVDYIFVADAPPGVYSRAWWKASKLAFKGLSPHIVHSQSIAAYGVLGDIRKRRLPLVATCHGTPLSDAMTTLRSFGARTNPAHLLSTVSRLPHHMKVYGSARRVLAVSPNVAEHLGSAGLAPRQKITVVLNGIDTDVFTPEEWNAAAGPANRGPVIFSLSRVVEEKGFQFLVRAMHDIVGDHPDARLVIGGTGPYVPQLKAIAGKEGVGNSVDFTGPIPEEWLAVRYRACDLFALATTHVEGLPLVLPEALACGKPIAASRIGGVPDVVREGITGRLFRPGDQKSITGTLRELVSDTGRLRAMGKAARDDAVARFSARRMALETAGIYEEVSSCPAA